MDILPIIEKLKKEIEGIEVKSLREEIGKVEEVGDGIAKISGLSGVTSQEMLEFETSSGTIFGLAFSLEEDNVGAVILGNFQGIKEGDTVKRTLKVLSIEAGDYLLGRVIDPLGKPLDEKGKFFFGENQGKFMPLERSAPGVLDREPVNTPLHTGIKAVDGMIPIGRGQRELIIGDREIGKTSIAIDAIINQGQEKKYRRPYCIYVAIGQKESKIAKTVEMLKKCGAMDYTIVVSAPAGSPSSLWYLAPFTGCALGEFFMQKGQDALVIYDDLTKHAWAYRELSLLLRRPPGREAYPGDIFYIHARLLERAAKLNKSLGSGSLTALPIIETQLGDVSAYIPTNVISITDGQIYLEPELFFQGQRPAVNVGLSVSRVGSAAQTRAMKKVAGRLRLELAQYRDLAAFAQFAADLDVITRQKLKRGRALTEILKQDVRTPLPFDYQAVSIFAGINGFFDDIENVKIRPMVNSMLDYLHKMSPEIFKEILETGEISPDLEIKLRSGISDFFREEK